MPAFVHSIAALDDEGEPIEASTFFFQSIKGVPELARRHVEVFWREGEDGTGLRDLGTWGEPFTMEAVEFCANRTVAASRVIGYQGYIGSGAPYGVVVVQAGVPFGPFAVLNVSQVGEIEPVDAVVGSIVLNPTALLTTRWELLH